MIGRVLQERAGTVGEIVLVGLLSSYGSVVTPVFLLLALALYELPVEHRIVVRGLRDLVAFEFSDIRARAQNFGGILESARAALAHPPNSLAPFVPRGDSYRWQPDRDLVTRLRESAEDGLRLASE